MNGPSLTAEEVLAWNDLTARNWHALIDQHAEILDFPCDIYGSGKTVAGLLQHIVAVELRYAQRLTGEPETPYEQVPASPASAIFDVRQEAVVLLRRELAAPRDWEETLTFQTISRGRMSATRRTVLFHVLFHSIRHYAQLATLVRQHGIQAGWPMDYMFMGMSQASGS